MIYNFSNGKKLELANFLYKKRIIFWCSLDKTPTSRWEKWKLCENGTYSHPDIYGERPDLVTHQYNEPGIKIIKAVVFSTITSDSYYNGYVQAIEWKLVTIKINITEDRELVSDFSDVGGDDFVYLPYPDVIKLDHGNAEDTDRSYKSSHVIISGLSEDSIYVKWFKKDIKNG